MIKNSYIITKTLLFRPGATQQTQLNSMQRKPSSVVALPTSRRESSKTKAFYYNTKLQVSFRAEKFIKIRRAPSGEREVLYPKWQFFLLSILSQVILPVNLLSWFGNQCVHCHSVADPGSGAFLTLGSGMGKISRSGSGMNIPDHISES
jgi:hypothetical protein